MIKRLLAALAHLAHLATILMFLIHVAPLLPTLHGDNSMVAAATINEQPTGTVGSGPHPT